MGFSEYREQETLPDLTLTAHQRTVHAGASQRAGAGWQHGELVSDPFKAFVTEAAVTRSVLDSAIRAVIGGITPMSTFGMMSVAHAVGHVGGAVGWHWGPVVAPAVDGARCTVSERTIATRSAWVCPMVRNWLWRGVRIRVPEVAGR